MKKRHGQSTVEFLLGSLLIFTIIISVLHMGMALSLGHYVQYATFMSARSLLSASDTRDDQRRRAREGLFALVKQNGDSTENKFKFVMSGDGDVGDGGAEFTPHSQFKYPSRGSSWLEGVRYTFRTKVFVAGPGTVRLTSESWLGREPSEEECLRDVSRGDPAIELRTGVTIDFAKPNPLLDNGC